MLWLLATILAYFLFAIVALGDKYLLVGRIPQPKVYSFYVGLLGVLAIFFIPFGFFVPKLELIFFSLLAGAIFIFALFQYYTALRLFEPSRIVPAIGGFLPFFTFALIYIFPVEKEILEFEEILAFILLILGSLLVTFEKKAITSKSLYFALIVAFFSSLALFLAKIVYSLFGFWPGFIWMRIGGFLAAIFFLLTPEVRQEIFQKRITFQKKTGIFFLSNQTLGATGFIFQNWAIALAAIIYLPIINALQGIQYAFLFIFTILISLKFPRLIKEKISKEIFLQKIVAIFVIGVGLAILAL